MANALPPDSTEPIALMDPPRLTKMSLCLVTDDMTRLGPEVGPARLEVKETEDELAVVAARTRRFKICREIIISYKYDLCLLQACVSERS